MYKILYGIIKVIFVFIFSCIFPTKAIGTENVPSMGKPVILAPNHLSNWDPPLVGAYIPRFMIYMAKEDLWNVPFLKYVMDWVKAIPVKREGADRTSIKRALADLKNGRCLCIFPEGARSKDGKLHAGAPGLGLLAAKSKVRVVPVAIIGTYKLKLFRPLTIVYGKPRYFEGKVDKVALQEFTDLIMSDIAELLEKHQGK